MIEDRTGEGSAARPAWFVEPTLGQRFFGALIDSLVLTPISALYFINRDAATILVAAAVRAVYVVALTARAGQTVGKIVMGTAALDAVDGTVIPVSRAVLRWFVLSGVVIVLHFVGRVDDFSLGGLYVLALGCTVLPGPLHRGLHDRAAGTVVTSVRPTQGRPEAAE